jgi:riboflavin biosynthesis pyrimidine reductase
LIDEYQFAVMPVFIGGGMNLVSGLEKNVSVDLLEAKQYPSGRLMLRYAPAT